MILHKQILGRKDSKHFLMSMIKSGTLKYGGNRKLKIYGRLSCKSGKRMNPDNRVFFYTEEEAIKNGYRPCGHCMHLAYKKWKDASLHP
jgi:methylphosphotriester-DNA--protein-cysteine methyltransferase